MNMMLEIMKAKHENTERLHAIHDTVTGFQMLKDEEKYPGTAVPSGFGVVMERRISMTFVYNFRCNDVQLEECRKNAEHALVNALYGPVENKLREVMTLLYGHEVEAAKTKLAEVLDMVGP